MAETEPNAAHQRYHLVVTATLLVSMAVLAATGLHLVAVAASRHAQGPGTLAARTVWARRAAAIEPWNPEFARRARVLRQWERGRLLLDVDDYNGAVDALREAYADDVGNTELLALFKQAQDTQALETNRKAHLQHGHEGPGGTLAPEDVER